MSNCNRQKSPKGIEIIAFDKNHNLQYEGLCKLSINVISEFILIVPFNEEFKLKSALFQWKFSMEKNILFIFGEHNFQDVALIFDTKERCKKAFDGIHKLKPIDLIPQTMIFERFLQHIFWKIAENDSFYTNTIKNWIEKFDGEESKEYKNMMKNSKIYDLIFRKYQDSGNSRNYNHRKRKYPVKISTEQKSKMTDDSNNRKKLISNKTRFYTKIIKPSNFMLVTSKARAKLYRMILIFTDDDKCFEYSWGYNKNIYFCRGCKEKSTKLHTAILEFDENGNFVVKMEEKSHVCDEIKYIPENYNEIKIIKKPDYQLLENCAGRKSTVLIIFDQNDRNQCYEYVWDFKSKRYCCRGCPSKQIKANLFNESTKDEYVEVENDNHKCAIRKYDPEKYTKFKKYVLKPDFEIISKGGVERRNLIIFDSNNRNLCYNYFYEKGHNYFVCCGCRAQNKRITAKLNKNNEGEEYVVLSTKKHVCELHPYKEAETILRPPDIELFDTNLTGLPRLLIFDSKDKSLCYIFQFASDKNKYNKYQCLGCAKVARSQKNAKGIVTCHLSNEKEENTADKYYYVRMKKDQKHICKPQNYETEKQKLMATNKTYDFFLFRQRNNPDSLKAVIYHPKNKNLFYQLLYCNKKFKCEACVTTKKKTITFPLYQDENEKEYFDHDFERHVCKPLQISKIKDSEIEKLESIKIFLEETKKKNLKEENCVNLRKPDFELEYDSRKFIESPNFTVFKQSNGPAKLIIFTSADKELCYEYTFLTPFKRLGYFRCHGCYVLSRKSLYAKIYEIESGEEYVHLLKNDHVCVPQKFVKEKFQPKILDSSHFILHCNDDGEENKRLIVFASSESRDFIYEYSRQKNSNIYACMACGRKKRVPAKLFKNEDNQNFIELSPTEHICLPKKYDPTKYELKERIYNNFYLQPHFNGGKKLVILDQNDKDFGYEFFYCSTTKKFYCSSCDQMKKTKTAKECFDENGKECLILNKEKHVCEIRNLRKNDLIFNDYEFKFHQKNNSKEIIVKHSTIKNGFYKFAYDSSFEAFCCVTCIKNKKQHTAMICSDKDDKTFLLLNRKNYCNPIVKA